ncbi:RSC chromatin remodeling complex ATPase subunit [Saccharomycopsis crataegensis]|uniref:RSC chromatin remodeling complex ATPase subunit n=1 Tax=Saccharomycopsis crataegensis TaxID=43959 RepID=A0AAV5QUD4_9ASCO|nr:RSC chromatin remodeling complex ATPase subunit [Saccharomycopsis crataegensis]
MSTAPLEIPEPSDSHEVELLLQRYNALYNHDTINAKKRKDGEETPKMLSPAVVKELNAIEKVLHKLSTDHSCCLDQWRKVKDLSSTNVASYDLDLLKKQIIGFNLLSRDLDLPNELQFDFGRSSVYGDDISLGSSPSSLSDIEDAGKLEPIEIEASNFEERYYNFIPKDSIALIKDDFYHDVVGNKYAETRISNKISDRVTELESLPSTIANINTKKLVENFNKPSSQRYDNSIDQLKVNSLVELKSLKLLAKQKQLRQALLAGATQKFHHEDLKDTSSIIQAKRQSNVRLKVVAPQTSRLAEQLEEAQKREQRNALYAKRRLVLNKKVGAINELLYNQNEVRTNRSQFFFKAVSNFHQQSEKEAAKRQERTAKERLQALKANDEEAYLKLLDQTKDTRITHLLRQTNSFLQSLADAVKVQQAESKQLKSKSGDQLENEEGDDEEVDNVDYYGIVHRVKENISKQPSILVGGTLKEYQLKGLEWMVSLYNNHLNGILADEMGLGKTIQSISLVTHLIEVKKERAPFLIIVPLSTITNWTLECERWAPTVKKIVYKGTPNQRKLLAHDVRRGDFQILLTTYEYIIKDKSLLSKIRWAHMIIDEGHRMKNSQSKLSFTLTTYYHTKNRLILTGTPLQNNLPELWALLNFVLPKIFNSQKTFDEWFNTPFANSGSSEKLELSEEENLLVIRRLHKVLRPFLLRRLKKDVEKDLPDKVEKVVKCKFSGLQYALYQQMLRHNALFLGSSINNGTTKGGVKGLNNKIMQLRKICNHPYVFEEVEDLINPSRLSNDFLWRVSGKFELLDRVLPKFKATNHRVLIFFQMTSVMDIMEDYLRYRGMQYLRLDGSTKADERQDMLKAFNAPNSPYFAFLLSTRAGGLGLNLQTADTVIIFDSDWNPHQDLQAQDRAHRIGQKNEVRILRLITNDSVEEVILERAHEKLNIDGKVIQAGKFDNKSSAEEQEAFLRRLLEAEEMRKKVETEEDDGNLDDDELNEILARSDDEKVLFKKLDKERQKEDSDVSRLMTIEELPDVFSEENVEKHLNKNNIEEEELGKHRERKRVMYDDGLTEEQWLEAIDDDEMTVEDAIHKNQTKLAKRNGELPNSKKRSRTSGDFVVGDDEEVDEEAGSSHENLKVEEMDENFSDDDLSDGEPKKKKKKKKSTKISNGVASKPNGKSSMLLDPESLEKCQRLLSEVSALTDDNNALLCELFLKLPSKKLYPDYYQIIEKPISISEISKNLKQNKYASYYDLINDFKLMIQNAKTYNEPESFVYENAAKIDEFIDKFE